MQLYAKVANVRVSDKEKFAEFQEMATVAIKKYGGKVLAKCPGADRKEGDLTGMVMMPEFESKEAADTFYHSEQYQAARAVRKRYSETDLMTIGLLSHDLGEFMGKKFPVRSASLMFYCFTHSF